eukprot:gene11927-15961_t
MDKKINVNKPNNGSKETAKDKVGKVTRIGAEIDLIIGHNDNFKTDSKIDNSFETHLPNESQLKEKYSLIDQNQISDEKSDPKISQQHEEELQEYRKRIIDLQKSIEEKNRKIENLNISQIALEPIPGYDVNKIQKLIDEGITDDVDFRDSKIVALAKKSHKLTMQLNKERATNESLSQNLKDLQISYDNLITSQQQQKNNKKTIEAKIIRNDDIQISNNNNEANKNIQLTKELRDIKKEMDELKRKNNQLLDENKNLTRTLTREIGDGIDFEDAIEGGWRGRAQHIIMLKSKIKKLEQTIASGDNTSNVSQYTRNNDVDAKAVNDLNGMSSERRQIVESLTEERFKLMDDKQKLESKCTAQKARIQILENECKKTKENVQILLDKSETDDQLVEALRQEITRLKAQLMKSKIDQTKYIENNEIRQVTIGTRLQQMDINNDSQNQNELLRLKRLCKNQQEQLDSQDLTIRNLKKSNG